MSTFSDIARTIAPFAETLATAFGSPIAGAAVHVVAEALGCDKKPVAVLTAISAASPDELLKLRQADAEFKTSSLCCSVCTEPSMSCNWYRIWRS